uniref:Leucine-rich repeat extensin-like protein 2 n=1 Tax=Hirondellea gigas TaxID=1518452 RepID=A0A6A7FSW3_9CRUS
MPSSRSVEGGDPRTPMAWQHRDLNYHQSGYQDRYGPGAEGGRIQGPPSSSDRVSHRTDKTWNTQKESNQGLLSPYNQQPQQQYPPRDYPSTSRDYPHSRELSPSEHLSPQQQPQQPPYQQRQQESRHSATATSTISSSSSEDDSEQPGPQGPVGPQHPVYGYSGPPPAGGYYPGYPLPPLQHPGYAPSVIPGYHGGGTMKSAKSVPALLAATYDGEPCPVHHSSVMGLPPHMSMPPMMHPGYATMGHPRRAASIYDMRMISSPPPPATIYGTLPHHMPAPLPDTRSVVGGSAIMGPAAPGAPLGIPPQLLPPMARPRPVVIGEGGAPEVLPVRGRNEKDVSALPTSLLSAKGAAASGDEDVKKIKKPFCCHGGACVCWIILSVIVIGIVLTLMLLFIL